MDKICIFLSDYATEKGVKQTYISQKTGIPVDTISRIFNGKRKILADEFIQICSALEIPQVRINALTNSVLSGSGQ